MKLVDLSYTININTVVLPFDQPPFFENIHCIENDGVEVKSFKFSTHTGTHIDFPSHILKGGKSANDYAIERFVGKGTVLNFKKKKHENAVTGKDISNYRGIIKKGSFVIINTGWQKYYGTADYFAHPFLDESAASVLRDLEVGLVGIDACSVDASFGIYRALIAGYKAPDDILSRVNRDNFGGPAHSILLGSDILIAENLCNLDCVGSGSGLFSFIPLNIENSDGSPSRASYIET